MQKFYKEQTANFPRLRTDRLFYNEKASSHYEGILDESVRYIEDFQLIFQLT